MRYTSSNTKESDCYKEKSRNCKKNLAACCYDNREEDLIRFIYTQGACFANSSSRHLPVPEFRKWEEGEGRDADHLRILYE